VVYSYRPSVTVANHEVGLRFFRTGCGGLRCAVRCRATPLGAIRCRAATYGAACRIRRNAYSNAASYDAARRRVWMILYTKVFPHWTHVDEQVARLVRQHVSSVKVPLVSQYLILISALRLYRPAPGRYLTASSQWRQVEKRNHTEASVPPLHVATNTAGMISK